MPVASTVASGGPYVLPTDSVLGQGPADTIGFFNGTPVPQMLQGTLFGTNGLLNVYAVSASPASVAPNTTQESSITATGAASTDMVVAAIKPTSQAGLAVGTARVSGTNTVQVSFGNFTGSTITPTTTETYLIVTAPAAMQYTASLSPASVAASTTVEQTFAIPGVQMGMVIAVNKPTVQAGLLVTGARVVSAGNVGVTFANVTGSAITPTAAQTYKFFAAQGLKLQPVMTNLQVSVSPASVAANTTAEQTFTVNGVVSGQPIAVTDTSGFPSGLCLVGARASAANTIALNFGNATAGALTPPALVLQIGYFPDPAPASGSSNSQLATIAVDFAAESSRLGLTSPQNTAGIL
ncbi:MAG TPA: hypothetical protein VGR45_15125 [Stellaceae bacterium]|nr:hypothetical protein [Stellaceae bacterium]